MIALYEQYKDNYDLWVKYGLDVEQIGNGTYHGNINLRYLKLSEIPDFGIHTVDGNFLCAGSTGIHSLKNCPSKILGNFDCSSCGIVSLEFGPHTVNGTYNCAFNKITSLKHSPAKHTGEFNLCGNLITSLEHAPENCSSMNATHNLITALAYIPEKIVQVLMVKDNLLLSNCHDDKNYKVELDNNQIDKNVEKNSVEIKDELLDAIELLDQHQVNPQLAFFKRHNAIKAYDIMFEVLKQLGYSGIEKEEDESELF